MHVLKCVFALAVAIWTLWPSMGALASEPADNAPLPVNALDVIDLKLGMSIEETKSILQTYNSRFGFQYGYLADNGRVVNEYDDHGEPFPSHPLHDSKLQLPVVLYAFAPASGRVAQGKDFTVNTDTPVTAISAGEWIAVYFSLDEQTQKVIAIARKKIYFRNLAELQSPGVSAPEVNDVKNSLLAKYHAFSNTTTTTWSNAHSIELRSLYDVRGRLLPKKHIDFGRCGTHVYFSVEPYIDMPRNSDLSTMTKIMEARKIHDWWNQATNNDPHLLVSQPSRFFPHVYAGVADFSRAYGDGGMTIGVEDSDLKDCGVELSIFAVANDATAQGQGVVSILFTTLVDLQEAFIKTNYASYAARMKAGTVEIKKEKF